MKKAIEIGGQSREFLAALKDEILWGEKIVEVVWRGKEDIFFVRSIEVGEWGGV